MRFWLLKAQDCHANLRFARNDSLFVRGSKKNYWDTTTGKLNTYAIVQFAPEPEKRRVFRFLLAYFGYTITKDGTIRKASK